MKPKLIFATLILSATLAHAHLTNRGSFDPREPLTHDIFTFFRDDIIHLVAGGNIVNGVFEWSPFTFLNDRFTVTLNGNLTGAFITWDLAGSGFYGLDAFVEGADLDHLYGISSRERFEGSGFIELNGTDQPLGFTFFAKPLSQIPDTGSTFILLTVAVVALLAFKPRHKVLCP